MTHGPSLFGHEFMDDIDHSHGFGDRLVFLFCCV